MQLAWGYTAPLIIEAALKAGVFDILDKGPRTAEQLVTQTGASARGLRAILDVLVGLNFAQRKGNRYALTPAFEAFPPPRRVSRVTPTRVPSQAARLRRG